MAGQTTNGVDVARLFETIEAVQADSRLAAFKFRARNRWVGGGENRTTIDDYDGGPKTFVREQPFELVNDEPPVLLGSDRGPNPVEFVLHALAGCLTTSLVYHAAAKGIRIDSVETRFEGDIDLRGFLGLDPQVRNGYREIRVVMQVEGDAPESELAALCTLAQKRSPVFDIVSHGTNVAVQFERAPATAA